MTKHRSGLLFCDFEIPKAHLLLTYLRPKKSLESFVRLTMDEPTSLVTIVADDKWSGDALFVYTEPTPFPRR